MKRNILALGLLSLCCLASFTTDSQAFFGLLSPWHRHNRYVTQITCRPYNAFTPICWGNLVCDGCCPSPCGVASGQMPMTMGAPPWACPGYGGGPGPQGCMASDMPLMQAPPMPDIRNQPFNAPMPAPMPQGPNMTMYPQPNVAQANYYPMVPQQYYPNYYMPNYYNPAMGWPNMQPAPYYWYGNGR